MSAIAQTIGLRGFRISGFIRDVVTSAVQYRLYRKTLAELQSLSDHELDDLGLTRATLRSVAYGSVYKA